jgi:hypothetical protein
MVTLPEITGGRLFSAPCGVAKAQTGAIAEGAFAVPLQSVSLPDVLT